MCDSEGNNMGLAKNKHRGQRSVSVTDWTDMGIVFYSLLCFLEKMSLILLVVISSLRTLSCLNTYNVKAALIKATFSAIN